MRAASDTSVLYTPGRLERRATSLICLIAGLALSTWAPLVPLAKARASLDEGTLGVLLLCLGGGSIVAMPPSGALTTSWKYWVI